MQKRRLTGLWLSGTVLGLSCSAAGAQEVPATPAGAEGGFEEIIVTARKRAESLQDVPVTVAAISQDQLANNIATDLSKVAELAPQVMIGRFITGSGAVITIRGISALPSDSGFDQSVAVSIDGIALSRGRIIGASMFDTRQVEVLEGPQALFFGKNSPAGVISIQTADPTDSFEGYVRGGYEFVAKEKYVEGAVSGPLTSTLKARLAARASWLDGWIRNNARAVVSPFNPAVTYPGATAGRTSPMGHDYAARATLLWTPTDDFKVNLKLTHNQQRSNSNGAQAESYCIGSTSVPVEAGRTMAFADCAINREKAESSQTPQFARNHPYGNGGIPYAKSQFSLGSLRIDKDFGDISLVSQSGFYQQTVSASYSGDFSPYTQIYPSEHEWYRLFTQEVRLNTDFDGPVNFMGGVYYEHSDRKWENAVNLFNVYDPAFDNYLTNHQKTDSKNDTFSGFGQLRWNITPELELAGGVRYTHEVRKSALVNLQNNLNSATGRTLYPQGKVLRSRYTDDNFSPEATLTWHPAADQTVYVAYKTGYKSGGVSNAALLPATATPESVKVGAEEAKGFEFGYKADLFDRKLRMALSAYTYKFTGLQVVFSDTQAFRYRVGNAAESKSEGVMLNLSWRATADLTLTGTAAYNDAHYVNFPGAQCYSGEPTTICIGGVQDLSGKALPRAPKFTGNLGAEYTAELGEWKADLSASGAYSSSYQTASDYGPGGRQPSYWRLNAAIHLSPQSERFRLSLIGRNLTNSYYKIATFTHPGAGNPNQFVSVFNRPREVAVQAEVKF